ncbi:hypothetical protein SDJN02_09372, partial [Cucurbita argyrosperma subsp. argyrosperma]
LLLGCSHALCPFSTAVVVVVVVVAVALSAGATPSFVPKIYSFDLLLLSRSQYFGYGFCLPYFIDMKM